MGGGCNPYFNVYNNHELVYCSKEEHGTPQVKDKPQFSYDLNVMVDGEVKVEFLDHDTMSADDYMFYFCFNTAYVEGNVLRLPRVEVDKANAPKHLKKFNESVREERGRWWWWWWWEGGGGGRGRGD